MRIDAHHHLWRYDPAAFGWIAAGSDLARDFTADDFRAEMAAAGVDGAIAVQARQNADETRFLLDAAKRAPILGVVGWIDLRADDIDARLDTEADPLVVGYRHIVQDEAGDAFLLGDAFVRGVRAVAARGLTYDLLVNHRQLGSVPAFLDRVGDGRFVLDHAAKPDIMGGGWQSWASEIARVAAYGHVFCKVSGLVTEADHARWTPADIERYLLHVLEIFGSDRLIWGSDWPVCLLAADYGAVRGLIEDFVARHCPAAQDAVFAGNAIRAYNLKGMPA